MGLFCGQKKILSDLLDTEKAILEWLTKSNTPRLVFTTIINNFKIQIMGIQLKSNEKVDGQLQLQDQVTGDPIAATLSNVQATSDNEEVVKAIVNPDNSVTATAVAPGNANITVKADVSYTDSTGAAVQSTFQTVVLVVITQKPNDVALIVNWGTPVAQ